MVMSWGNFEELKKFARKHGSVKKKRPPVGWQNPSASKKRRTDNGSLSFVSNIESGDIEGFSTDEEKDDDVLDCPTDSLPKNLPSKLVVKRKYSKRQTLPDERSSTSADSSRNVGSVQKGKELWDCKSFDFLDEAYELLQYAEETKEETELVWCASDDEELPQVFSDGSDSDDANAKLLSKRLGLKSSQGSATTKGTNDCTSASGEAISDFQSDQESSSSQESLSADISTPTPTPVSPVVVGTPRTASEWLKQVQQKSPEKSEDDKSPEGRGDGMNQWDSAKKKRKFVRSGLAEQLQHIISREQSEKAFWNHRVTDTEKKNSSTCASLEMEGCVTIQILYDQLQDSLHLTQCCMLCKDDDRDPQQRLVIVLFTCETWKQLTLQVGTTVKIHPPWQKLDISGVPCPVLLCTYFCEKQPADQSPAVQLQSIKGGGLLMPSLHTSPSTSSLLQSPQKGFKPSKLLFGNAEDASMVQTKLASSLLTTVTTVTSRPHTSILNAIESCGGYSGALVTIQCLIQRVYCKKIKLARDNEDINSCSQLLNQHLKTAAKTVGEVEQDELRWVLLVQDCRGMCAEIQVPPKYQDLLCWRSCLGQGEGKVCTFSHVRVQQRTNRIRSPGLFSIIQSLWSRNGDNTVTRHNGSSQIVTQESGSQASTSSPPPNFCYVLTVQQSSQAVICEDDDIWSAGFLHKPCTIKTLWDVLHMKEVERISALCKLLYCRVNGSSASNELRHSTFELFVTDLSMQNATEFEEERSAELLSYVKIVGKSCHVLLKEVREARTNCGTILSTTHLLLEVQEYQELVADTYSLIRKAVPDSTTISPSAFHEDHVPQEAMDSLSCLKPAPLPCLTRHSCCGYIYRVEGVVIGVDEESACCWLVCDTCGNADITVKQRSSSQFFCSSCNGPVESPQTKTHLAVLVKVKSFPEASVKVTLQQSTIDKMLPVSYQDSDQGYDIEAVLGKQLEPMNCYITERSEHQDGRSNSFCLEEIHIH